MWSPELSSSVLLRVRLGIARLSWSLGCTVHRYLLPGLELNQLCRVRERTRVDLTGLGLAGLSPAGLGSAGQGSSALVPAMLGSRRSWFGSLRLGCGSFDSAPLGSVGLLDSATICNWLGWAGLGLPRGAIIEYSAGFLFYFVIFLQIILSWFFAGKL